MTRKRRLGLRTRLAAAFLIFSAIVIGLLWILQVVFLNDVYKAIKTDSVRRAASRMAAAGDEELSQIAADIADSYGICTTVYDGSMNEIARVHTGGRCLVHSLDPISAAYLYEAVRTRENGKLESYLRAEEMDKILERVELSRNFFRMFDRFSNNQYGRGSSNAPYDCILFCEIVQNDQGETRFILLSSEIIPVDATVDTIRFEMLIISGVLLVVSMLLSFFLAMRIAKPLVRLNEASRQLPKGEFDPAGIRGDREIMELSDTLSRSAAEIRKVENLRRELVANVSHDLRTPLTLIAGYSEVMRDLPGENTPENLQIVIDETHRLSDLVTDLLDLSKMEAGMDTLKPEKVEFVSFVKSIIRRYEKLTENDGYQVRFRSEPDACWIMADPVKLNQAVYNLVNNAINYCGEDKTVEVVLSLRNGAVRLDVIDHGEGIPEEKLADIWDRYYRVDKNHRQAKVGTGLGLSIVKAVLLQHKAVFGVDSAIGRGSDFWFELPTIPE
ncbi:MAG: two-component sensor histidine kinase [Clostridia bacterium]|nr:two-component sensor histidine kinase [Clostridia bacterium]